MSDVVTGDVMSSRPDYWSETRRPLVALVFLTPLLLIYEAGVIWVGGRHADAVRNGADYWMRGWLHQVGIDRFWLLPVLLIAALLVWHVRSRHPWRVSKETLLGMLAESLLFAFALVLIGQLNDLCFRHFAETPLRIARIDFGRSSVARVVSFLGAGIYEESLFRLCLLPLCYGLARLLLAPPRLAGGLAILVTSLVFAFAHYVGPSTDLSGWQMLRETATRICGDRSLWQSFVFRVVAGLFFAGLFVFRGFGVTVGCHAAYDVLVGVLMASEL